MAGLTKRVAWKKRGKIDRNIRASQTKDEKRKDALWIATTKVLFSQCLTAQSLRRAAARPTNTIASNCLTTRATLNDAAHR